MKKINTKSVIALVLCSSLFGVVGWPDISLKKLTKDVATSTGVVTGSQVDALVDAGAKLQEASNTLTPEQEYYLGRGVSALILRKYPLYRGSPELTHYLNVVGNALAARSSQPEIFSGYHFAIIDTPEINALSAPGGFIYISRGFLKVIPDEEALAGVLAHEIGHVIKRHGVNAISNAHLTEAVMILGKEAASDYGPSQLNALTNAFGESADKIFDTLIKSGYSRSQEYEADAFAAALVNKTGYSVSGLTAMFDRLAANGGQARGGWSDTHPSPKDRKAELKLPKQTVDPKAVELRSARYGEMIKKVEI